MKINILMSTYNGEKYLAEQIKSIQKQTIKNWELLIRDDGSSDRTLEIIEDFENTDSRIRLINRNSCENFGVIKNFYTLLKYDQADFYFFSDQDDIWLPNKLEVTLAEAEKYQDKLPLLVYTDLKVVNQNLQVIHESMIKTQSDHANTKLVEELTENTVTGGTTLINHALASLWTEYDHLLMHDWFLALLAAAMGHLVYLDIPTELYRQHESNVLGARTWSKRMRTWLKPHQLVAKYWWLITSSQKQARKLLNLPLQSGDQEMVQAYVELLDKPLIQRLKSLKSYDFRKNRPFHTLVFRTLIITKFGYRRK
ncbi:glycosyltransferase family 2 protein [Streptococcus didelphis]|uniref:Glycosyltransferase family 2 protein n=1 Tax=Streptococcus didelphis TaxID=102886 RepID=A0ABY9LHQ1_9STRE|nr:glycosyltransferase family 2 protein [Streptococcus didelphis]WMB28362.1 glycosyltransferase family 2 protein [Streptococcus didelphis]WMB29046.1 glycosyltransferase family 2 protein [Streptococcus didelphis]